MNEDQYVKAVQLIGLVMATIFCFVTLFALLLGVCILAKWVLF